jgi:hypothetical protein
MRRSNDYEKDLVPQRAKLMQTLQIRDSLDWAELVPVYHVEFGLLCGTERSKTIGETTAKQCDILIQGSALSSPTVASLSSFLNKGLTGVEKLSYKL